MIKHTVTTRAIILAIMGIGLFGCQGLPKPSDQQTAVLIDENNLPIYGDLTQQETQATLKKLQQMRAAKQAAKDNAHQRYQGPIRHIWDRIFANQKIHFESNIRIERQINFFLNKPGYLKRVSQRAEPFIYYIVEELAKRKLPADLAFLPIIESAYRPTARSRSSAVGLWQFIPSTSRFLGMPNNWWYDSRRDTLTATQHALDYLQFINEKFNGDWLLTLAAYNAGHGKVSRAIALNAKQGKPTDYWHLKLPRETMFYVPNFLAISHIFQYSQQFQVDLHPVPNQPFFTVINLPGQIAISQAAETTGLSVKQLRHYNAGFLRTFTPPNGPHRLILPLNYADRFNQALPQLAKQKPFHLVHHTIKRGDSLSRIALRYGSKIAMIKQFNKIKGSMIYPKHTLLIPVPITNKTTAMKKAHRIQARQTKGSYYTVRLGDTLWDIAQAFNMKLKNLLSLNQLNSKSILQPGQKILIKALNNI